MREVLRRYFPDLVVLLSALGFLTLLAELLLTEHTEGIQALAPLGACIGAGAGFLGLLVSKARGWAIGILLGVGALGPIGFAQHLEEAWEAYKPATVQRVDKEGEWFPAYPRLGEGDGEEEAPPPPLAPLALSGLGLLGALALYVRTP